LIEWIRNFPGFRVAISAGVARLEIETAGGICHMDTKAELRVKHGTPEEFEIAVWAAWADLFITTAEALEGIKKYKLEWDEAE